ncbi:MAG: phosphate acetyltransferase [Planctomycetota bacterium]
MPSTIELLSEQVRTDPVRVVLPETDDPRVLQAANELARRGLALPILIGSSQQLASAVIGHESISFVDPADSDRLARCADHLFSRRQHKGMTREQALEQAADPVYFAALLVAIGEADAAVAGSVASTAHVVRSVLHSIGTAADTKSLSSFFLMQFPDRAVTYADCGLIPDPDESQLADIAIAAAKNHTRLTGESPRVAMLSFSTHGSAKHPRTEKVIAAVKQVQSRMPTLNIDGELQFDAAWVPEVAQRKCPDSNVAGRANVLIFPDLDSGNIAYKITERLGGAQALGPLIQGAAKPMMDLSRGCSADDIVNVAVIASIMAKN